MNTARRWNATCPVDPLTVESRAVEGKKRVVTSPTRGMARVRLYGTGVVDEGEKPPILNYVAPVILGVAALGGVAATLNAL